MMTVPSAFTTLYRYAATIRPRPHCTPIHNAEAARAPRSQAHRAPRTEVRVARAPRTEVLAGEVSIL